MDLTFPIRSDKLTMSVAVKEHLASVKSDFQQIDVYDTEVFGKVLLLDGHVQLAELDEKAYHEALVWVPLLNLVNPKRALVVGGGDGGVLRELCKHPTLEWVDMVEIDAEVVQVSRQHLPGVSAGAFDDSRVHLHLEDAFQFVKRASGSYDLVVMDCTDVYEEEDGELSEMLFTPEFYADVAAVTAPQGFVVSQADNPVFCPYSTAEVQRLIAGAFPRVGHYWALVPSFGGFSAFCWGGHDREIESKTLVGPRADGFEYLDPTTYELGFHRLPF